MKVELIYTSTDWEALTLTPYTRRELATYLLKNNGATLTNLHNYVQSFLKTSIDLEVFTHYMNLWDKHYTTYFESHGRIIRIPVEGTTRWFYLKKDHPYSRSGFKEISKYIKTLF